MTVIFSQNEDSNNVYFILSGEVRVVQCIEIKYPDEQEHHLNFDNLSDDDIDDVDDGDASSTQRSTSSTAATTFKGQHVPSLKLPGPSALKSPQSQPSSSSSTFSSAVEDANTSRKSARKGGVTIRLPGDEDVNEADSIQTSKSHHQPIPQSSLTSSSSSIPKLRLDRLSGGSNIASKASASSYFHVMNDSTSVASEKSLKQHSLKAASKFSHPNSSRNAQELKLPKINKYPSSSASSAQTARNSIFRNQHSATASSSIPPSTRYHSTRNIRHSSADSARSDVSTPSMLSARSKLMKSFRERNAPSRPTHQLVDLGELGPKQYFGELGVLLDKPRSASVFAKTRVEVLHISKGDFLSRMPESALDYFRQFSKYYPSYDAIMAMINRQQKWDSFKDKLVDQTLREYRR
jgi:CRP-like cAMP-binding protein